MKLQTTIKVALLASTMLILPVANTGCGKADTEKSLKHFQNGKRAYGQRKLGLAVSEFQKAVDADGKFLAARIMKGKAEFYQGKFKKSVDTFSEILADFPGNAAAHYWLGRTYLQVAGQQAKARRHLLQAVSLNDNYFNAHFYLGVLYEREGKVKEALLEYRRATLIKKDFDRIHRRLAGLYRRAGFPDRAARELNKVQVK